MIRTRSLDVATRRSVRPGMRDVAEGRFNYRWRQSTVLYSGATSGLSKRLRSGFAFDRM